MSLSIIPNNPGTLPTTAVITTPPIPASTSYIVQSLPTATCKWIVSVIGTTEYTAYEVLGTFTALGLVDKAVYSFIGNLFQIDADVINDNGNLALIITNNSLETVVIKSTLVTSM